MKDLSSDSMDQGKTLKTGSWEHRSVYCNAQCKRIPVDEGQRGFVFFVGIHEVPSATGIAIRRERSGNEERQSGAILKDVLRFETVSNTRSVLGIEADRIKEQPTRGPL